MAKKRIISKPGLFGMTYHYENGKYIGKSRPGLFGGRKIHYDADGNLAGISRPGAFADQVRYDKKKQHVSSYPGIIGENYFSGGSPIGKTMPGAFDENYTLLENDDYLRDEISVCVDDVGCIADEFILDESFSETQSRGKIIIKKAIGVLFAIEVVFFFVLTIMFVRRGQNIAPGVAACIISAGVAFFCLRHGK